MPSEIWLYDEIGSYFEPDEEGTIKRKGVLAEDVQKQLAVLDEAEPFDLRINCPGGDVFEAVAIKKLLDEHRGPIAVKIDGLSGSAATLIQLAGDTVEMAKGAKMFIHEPYAITVGDSADHASKAKALEDTAEMLAGEYAKRGTANKQTFRELMRAETWLSEAEAVSLGFVDGSTGIAAKHCDIPDYLRYPKAPEGARVAEVSRTSGRYDDTWRMVSRLTRRAAKI